MARIAFKMRLKPGCEEIYKAKHDAIWPELADLLRQRGIRNYSIFRHELDLFAYLETDGAGPMSAEGESIEPVQRDWWLMMEPYMECNDDHSPRTWPMDEVFHQE